ncbi:aromatic acid exporter family protein [Streptomyces sp. NPDC048637]|uniref:aromatic acid exporter family protein n=1 Tax=Streptomyces sp. NPDC048637 TaxID=3155636 RepID=UPI003431C4B1
MLLIAKGTLAATIAWVVSYHLLRAQSPAFAPFSAVLIMQVTVYQSLLQSSRYVGAVVAGVAVQAALGFLVGPDVLTFALVAAVALTIGRWRARAEQTGELVTQARTGLRMAQESLHYNPRRLFRRGRATHFEGYAAVLEARERTLRQVTALTRSLDSGVRTRTATTTAPFWRATPISWSPSPGSPASSPTSTRTGSATRRLSCVNWPTRHRTTAGGRPNRQSGTTCRSRTPAAPMACWSSRPLA